MDAYREKRANMYQFLSYMFAGEIDMETAHPYASVYTPARIESIELTNFLSKMAMPSFCRIL